MYVKKAIGTALLVGVAAALWGFVLHTGATIPVVQQSTSTGACVAVLPDGDCDAKPDRYITEWVK